LTKVSASYRQGVISKEMRDAATFQRTQESIDQHFAGRSPVVRQIYDRLLKESRRLGTVTEDPKKTSIHLVNRTAFAGIQNRRAYLLLTLKSKTDLASGRIFRRQQASANRWHLETKLDSVGQVDDELKGWLRSAYEISG